MLKRWKNTWFLYVIGVCVVITVVGEDISDICRASYTEAHVGFECSCISNSDTLMVSDNGVVLVEGGNANNTIALNTMPLNTTYWDIGGCDELHLSGSILTTLPVLHTLHLHDITTIHVAVDFFLHTGIPLKTLHLYNTSLSEKEDFLNIHADKLETIILDKMILHGMFKLLVAADEDGTLDLISITNSNIDILGEINISPLNVKKFVVANNTIGTIVTGAIMHNSSQTIVTSNTINNISYLAFESDTQYFTLAGNTIASLAIESLVINNATKLTVTNNSFQYIEKYGFAWFKSKKEGGTLMFNNNHFYGYETGSLIFYHTNENLVIDGNILHSPSCNCSTMKLLERMTEGNETTSNGFTILGREIFTMFKSTSYCQDAMENKTDMSTICQEKHDEHWTLVIIMIIFWTVIGILIIFLAHYCYNKKYRRFEYSKHSDQDYIIDDWDD